MSCQAQAGRLHSTALQRAVADTAPAWEAVEDSGAVEDSEAAEGCRQAEVHQI